MERRDFEKFIEAMTAPQQPQQQGQAPAQAGQQANAFQSFTPLMNQLQQATNSMQDPAAKQAVMGIVNPFMQQMQKIAAYYQQNQQGQQQPNQMQQGQAPAQAQQKMPMQQTQPQQQ